VIPLREQEYIQQRFSQTLEGKVKIDYFTQKPSALYLPGREECATCEDVRKMLEELASLSEKIQFTMHELAEAKDEAKKLKVDKVPGIVVRGPMSRPLRYFGMPGGNEFPNFIEALELASKTKLELGEETSKALKKLKDRVSITVFVTPTCPYCPGVVRAAYRLALAGAHVEAAAVEVGEFPRLAQQIGVRAVPMTLINDRAAIAGALDEGALLLAARKVLEGNASQATSNAGATTTMPLPGAPPAPSPVSGLILPR
jgi:glutaredoxin-like protein